MRGDDMLAAEHALGLLEGDALRDARRRELDDPAFAARVAGWAASFADGLADEIDPVAPASFAPIERRLFQTGKAATGWLGWLVAGVTAAALAVVLALTPWGEIPDGPRPTAVAELVSADGGFRAVALLDAIDHKVELAVLEGAPPEGRVFELWVLRGDLAPVSLGVIDTGATTAVVPDRVVRASGTVSFAVSVEPPGGAPAGTPGDILAIQPTSGL